MKIRELTLYTDEIDQLAQFYKDVIGFKVEDLNATSFKITIGSSELIYAFKKGATPYHYAINIPENSIELASYWLRRRISLIAFEKNELIDFPDWNARSIYFRDPSNNIVELISRAGIGSGLTTEFKINNMLNISEIGIGTDKIEQNYQRLKRMGAIAKYSGDLSRFCALGDPEGLIIFANPKLKTWFPTNDKIYASELMVRGAINFEFTDGIIQEIL